MLSDDEVFEKLCALKGVTAEYSDIFGNLRRTSTSTKLALLSAMGLRVDTSVLARRRSKSVKFTLGIEYCRP